MIPKESPVVEIASREEFVKFVRDFSNGGGIGVERNNDRYFVYTPNKKAELRFVYRGSPQTVQDLLNAIEISFATPRRTAAEIQLNDQYTEQ